MQEVVQADFAEALLLAVPPPPDVAVPGGADPRRRFGVHRNNVVGGLINAVATRFPVVERLVGAEFFREMARVYVSRDPPRSPILLRYGSTFPAFIEGFAPVAAVPYLADVARLELARGCAYHAADALPLAPHAFADLKPGDFARTSLRLHPSVNLLTSPWPIVSIWQAHQGAAEPAVANWTPEAALVARPDLDVEVRHLPPGGYQFLTALAQRASFSRAAAIAATEAPGFDPLGNLALLIEARIAVSMVTAQLA
jgi:hypothetical protein